MEAPSVEDTVLILKGIRSKYEEHHNVNFSDKALDAAAKLTDRYVTGRYLPDKAIDAIDEAGARSRMQSMQRPPEIEKLSDEIKEVCARKNPQFQIKISKKLRKREIRRRSYARKENVS